MTRPNPRHGRSVRELWLICVSRWTIRIFSGRSELPSRQKQTVPTEQTSFIRVLHPRASTPDRRSEQLMKITTLGEPRFGSPVKRSVSDEVRVPLDLLIGEAPTGAGQYRLELAGPRSRLYFDPAHTKAGVVTCGGLCPGLNNVIRSLFMELYHGYGVKDVLGFRNGYEGLDPAKGAEPMALTCECVDSIHRSGGTILGTSRGPVDI